MLTNVENVSVKNAETKRNKQKQCIAITYYKFK